MLIGRERATLAERSFTSTRFGRAIALTAAMLATACGGGGDATGVCVFGPEACARSSGGSGNAVPSYSMTGSGDTVFSLPSAVGVVRIQGEFTGTSSNFMVTVGGRMIVNEVLGSAWSAESFDGVYVVPRGGLVQITNSLGVEWAITAASVSPASSAPFNKTGFGDDVFELPARSARYRIQASYDGPSSNFIVTVAGSQVVNELLGRAWSTPVFAGTYLLPSAGRVEITESSGVIWSIVETQ